MVLVGPYNDHGWSEAHYVAAQYVEKKIPGAKMIYLDKVNSADRKGVTLDSVVADMVSKGAKIIFTTSDDFMQDTRTAAEKYKDITFINISGDDVMTGKAPKNLGNYMGQDGIRQDDRRLRRRHDHARPASSPTWVRSSTTRPAAWPPQPTWAPSTAGPPTAASRPPTSSSTSSGSASGSTSPA